MVLYFFSANLPQNANGSPDASVSPSIAELVSDSYNLNAFKPSTSIFLFVSKPKSESIFDPARTSIP